MLSTSSLEKVLASFLELPDAAASAAPASVTADADANPEAPLHTVSIRPTFAADRGCKAAAATLLTDERDIRSYIYIHAAPPLSPSRYSHARAPRTPRFPFGTTSSRFLSFLFLYFFLFLRERIPGQLSFSATCANPPPPPKNKQNRRSPRREEVAKYLRGVSRPMRSRVRASMFSSRGKEDGCPFLQPTRTRAGAGLGRERRRKKKKKTSPRPV